MGPRKRCQDACLSEISHHLFMHQIRPHNNFAFSVLVSVQSEAKHSDKVRAPPTSSNLGKTEQMCYNYPCVKPLFSTPTYPNPLWSSPGPAQSILPHTRTNSSFLIVHASRLPSPATLTKTSRIPQNARPDSRQTLTAKTGSRSPKQLAGIL